MVWKSLVQSPETKCQASGSPARKGSETIRVVELGVWGSQPRAAVKEPRPLHRALTAKIKGTMKSQAEASNLPLVLSETTGGPMCGKQTNG